MGVHAVSCYCVERPTSVRVITITVIIIIIIIIILVITWKQFCRNDDDDGGILPSTSTFSAVSR
jgi:hypothetical protein